MVIALLLILLLFLWVYTLTSEDAEFNPIHGTIFLIGVFISLLIFLSSLYNEDEAFKLGYRVKGGKYLVCDNMVVKNYKYQNGYIIFGNNRVSLINCIPKEK